jgi:hypothetical protein
MDFVDAARSIPLEFAKDKCLGVNGLGAIKIGRRRAPLKVRVDWMSGGAALRKASL